MWIVVLFVSLWLCQPGWAAGVCTESFHHLTIRTDRPPSYTPDNEIYVLREGITLTCEGDQVYGRIIWQALDKKRKIWTNLKHQPYSIEVIDDKLQIHGSTTATRPNWAEDHSTQYRCLLITRSSQLEMSPAVAVRIPYYKLASIAGDKHTDSCCVSCSQAGFVDMFLGAAGNIKWNVMELLNHAILDPNRVLITPNRLEACISPSYASVDGPPQILEVTCVLLQNSSLLDTRLRLPLDIHRVSIRGRSRSCTQRTMNNSPKEAIKEILVSPQAEPLVECKLQVEIMSVLNQSSLDYEETTPCSPSWYYLTTSGMDSSISSRKGGNFVIDKFQVNSDFPLIFCCVAQKSMCKIVMVSVRDRMTISTSSTNRPTLSTITASSSTSTTTSSSAGTTMSSSTSSTASSSTSTTTSSSTSTTASSSTSTTASSSTSTTASSSTSTTASSSTDTTASSSANSTDSSLASTSFSTDVAAQLTSVPTTKQSLKSSLDNVKISKSQEEQEKAGLKPSHIVAIVIGSCAVIIIIVLVISFAVKDKLAGNRGRYCISPQHE
ncbi:uncharacterized protein [Watersipora subatra]|uniref:uncharacterized protein n=1 Tax=Watersipora subatra TaxID=2589382 RepID=UPI00355BE1BE